LLIKYSSKVSNMFFFLSKVLYALVAPLSLIVVFFILYAILKIKKFFYLGLAFLILLSNPYISAEVMKIWEIDPIEIKDGTHFDAIIVLGGFVTNTKVGDESRTVFSDGNDRLMQAIDLYKRGISNKIIYTAGSDTVFNKQKAEAELCNEFMIKIGIPAEDVLLESFAINTYENAVFTRNLLERTDSLWRNKTYLVLTSAFHMRRSIACFEKAGIKVVPYSVQMRGLRSKNTILSTTIPSVGALENWTFLLKEWIGMVVYKLNGYL